MKTFNHSLVVHILVKIAVTSKRKYFKSRYTVLAGDDEKHLCVESYRNTFRKSTVSFSPKHLKTLLSGHLSFPKVFQNYRLL